LCPWGAPNTHPPHTTLIYKHTRRNAKLQLEVRARHTGGPHTWPARRRHRTTAVCGTPNTIIQARSAEGAPSLAPSQHTVSPAQVQLRHALEMSESRPVPHPALAISPLHAILHPCPSCPTAVPARPGDAEPAKPACMLTPRRRTRSTRAPRCAPNAHERATDRTRSVQRSCHHAAPATSLRSRRSAILIVAATAAPTSVTPAALATDVASSLKGSC